MSPSGQSAVNPVALLPVLQVPVAAPAVPIDTHKEALIARFPASTPVAEAPMPPIVIATVVALPIPSPPMLAWNPINAIFLLSPFLSRKRPFRRDKDCEGGQGLRAPRGLRRRTARRTAFPPPRGLRRRRGRSRGLRNTCGRSRGLRRRPGGKPRTELRCRGPRRRCCRKAWSFFWSQIRPGF